MKIISDLDNANNYSKILSAKPTDFDIQWSVIFWTGLGGIPGIICGLYLSYIISPEIVRICFTSLVVSFSITLLITYILKKHDKPKLYSYLSYYNVLDYLLLIIAGITGGIMSGLIGNGIDFVVFSVMVLFFNIDEKTATLTSVIIMAINALAGFIYLALVLKSFHGPVYSYWLAAVPIVALGAPAGAMICASLKRQHIVIFLYGLIFWELFSSLCLIPLNANVIISGIFTFIFFASGYLFIYRLSMIKI